ncbi:jg11475, partial [Pararge aegeria aegeria]
RGAAPVALRTTGGSGRPSTETSPEREEEEEEEEEEVSTTIERVFKNTVIAQLKKQKIRYKRKEAFTIANVHFHGVKIKKECQYNKVLSLLGIQVVQRLGCTELSDWHASKRITEPDMCFLIIFAHVR